MTKHQGEEQAFTHLRYVKILVRQLAGDLRQTRARPSTFISNSENNRLNGKLHIICSFQGLQSRLSKNSTL